MNNKGFTLIELLITVAIIGILAGIAIPAYIGQQRKAARTEAATNLEALRLLQEQFYADNGRYNPVNSNINYNGTSAADNGIEDSFQRFNPGGRDNSTQFQALNYTYNLQVNAAGTLYTVTATGKAGRRSSGDVFTINQDNTRTGPW